MPISTWRSGALSEDRGRAPNAGGTLFARWKIIAINTDLLILQKRDMEYFVDRLGILR